MSADNNGIVGTSVGNTSSGPSQSAEVGAGNAAAPVNPVPQGPPQPGAPIVPVGFVAPATAKLRELQHPLPTQESHARAAAVEVANLASDPFWQGAEASGVLSPAFISILLVVAANWSDERTNTKAWSKYTAVERSIIWDRLLTVMNQFAPLLAAYLAANPSVVATMPATQAFLGARGTVAQRAANTRTAPAVARTRATKLTAQAATATATANAEEAAAALRHGTGDATVVTPAPSAPASTSGMGGVKIT